jgi:hypothetical protein
MAPYGSNKMCTAPIQCIWLQYNFIHLPYDNPKLPYGAYGSSLMPDDSHMVHTVQWDSTWCHMAPTWLPCGSSSFPRTPSTSHVAPYGPHMGCTWLQYGSHLVLKVRIWFTSPIWLSYSACSSHMVHVAPVWHMKLPYGACSSHMVHMAPI